MKAIRSSLRSPGRRQRRLPMPLTAATYRGLSICPFLRQLTSWRRHYRTRSIGRRYKLALQLPAAPHGYAHAGIQSCPLCRLPHASTTSPSETRLISQWRSGSIAPQLIDVMLTATDRLYIANVNLLLKGLDIDALYGVLLDYAGYRFGIRRPLVDTVRPRRNTLALTARATRLRQAHLTKRPFSVRMRSVIARRRLPIGSFGHW